MKERESRLLNERDEEDVKQMVEAVAVKTQVLGLGSLDAAIDTLKTKGKDYARDLQALSQSAKNFVGLYRQAKQLDVGDANASAQQINVMFVGALPKSGSGPATRSEVNVTPTLPPREASVSPAQGQALDVSVQSSVSVAPSSNAAT